MNEKIAALRSEMGERMAAEGKRGDLSDYFELLEIELIQTRETLMTLQEAWQERG